MKSLLEVMRLFHYVVGITTPKPEDERKILLLWIAILVTLVATGVGLVVFIIPRIVG
jgi:hypothetical protein